MKFNLDLRPKPRPMPEDLSLDVDKFVFETKLDGHRVTILKDAADAVTVVPRSPWLDYWPRLQHSGQIVRLVERMPRGSVLDGELIAPGLPATDVPSVLRGAIEGAFIAFAAPWWNDEAMRFTPLHDVRRMLHDAGISITKTVAFDGMHSVTASDMRAAAKALGIEGVVAKWCHYDEWWKAKQIETADVVVMGALPGKGKHAGRWGSLECGLYDESGQLVVVTSVGKGNDDRWRDESLDDLVGRVCEVEHEGMQSRGKMKFSRFMRWRTDKRPEECKLS